MATPAVGGASVTHGTAGAARGATDRAIGSADAPNSPVGGAAPSWQRPWETMRDRSTYAMSFACAFTTEAFIDLSRTFLQAVQSGEVENQAPHSAEGTVRLDDVYHLHHIAHDAHDAVARALGALGPSHRTFVLQTLGFSTALALALLSLAHLAFVSPFTQISAAQELSRAVYDAGGWAGHSGEEEWPPTIVQLEVMNTSWPENWFGVNLQWLEEAALEEQTMASNSSDEGGDDANSTLAAQSISENVYGRLVDFLAFGHSVAFPVPRYEITYGAKSGAWLEVQSPQARAALGMNVTHVRISAYESAFFGPRWARELLCMLRLYDTYILNALPLHFVQMHGDETSAGLRLHALVVNAGAQAVDLAPVAELAAMATRGLGWPRLRWLFWRGLSAVLVLLVASLGAPLLSAAVRRLLVLCVRVHVYSSYTLRQMRRYPFIAAPLRRVNCYSSNELLELWTAFAALAALMAWLLAEAARMGGFWAGMLICYALAEYWGIVHVRTVQSRWIFPRAVALLQGGALLHALWWPLCLGWLLLWAVASAQLLLMLTLMCRFDCHAALPQQPPHRLLFRSLLLPAVPLSRDAPECVAPTAGSLGVDKATQTLPTIDDETDSDY